MQQKYQSTVVQGSALIIAIDRDKFPSPLCMSDGLIPKLYKSPCPNITIWSPSCSGPAVLHWIWRGCHVLYERAPTPPLCNLMKPSQRGQSWGWQKLRFLLGFYQVEMMWTQDDCINGIKWFWGSWWQSLLNGWHCSFLNKCPTYICPSFRFLWL